MLDAYRQILSETEPAVRTVMQVSNFLNPFAYPLPVAAASERFYVSFRVHGLKTIVTGSRTHGQSLT